jgi:protein-tyrosine phosphatase
MDDRAAGAELHFHALPGVDDGPATVAESLELLRQAAADGTGVVIATPHVRGDFVTDVGDLPDRVHALQGAADAAGIPIELRPGGELGHDMVGRLSQSELQSIAQGPAHGRWLLVEAPFEPIEEPFHAATAELRDRGFGVLIAHPERSADAALDGARGLRHELAEGSLAQVNAQSITGNHGPAARAAALELIGERLISAVASDAHGPTRPPLLGEARARLLQAGVDPGLCRSLTGGGPRGLLSRGIAGSTALVA